MKSPDESSEDQTTPPAPSGEGRRVLLTGISGPLTSRLARSLEERDDIIEIIGVDTREPTLALQRTEFVRADIRNPLVARIVATTRVDTVIHMATVAGPNEVGGRARQKEQNVIGAMQLLAACQKSDHVRRFVLKSTTAVYGAGHDDPALFGEDDAAPVDDLEGFAKDAAEIEAYTREFGRRRPDVDTTILRFANFLGGGMDSVLGSFFTLPVVPSVLGYDPRLQFCHEDDGHEVLLRAATMSRPGTYNVAGPGVVYLSQCVRKAGRFQAPVPSPLVDAVSSLVRRSKRVDFSPEQLRFLRYGRAVDTSRLTQEFGYSPMYTSDEAFDDFLARRRVRALLSRDDVIRWEKDLYDFLQRKGQESFLATRTRP